LQSLDHLPLFTTPGAGPAAFALENEVGGPTKAWESRSPNALWKSDIMDGPSLKSTGAKAERSWLIPTLDDHSRLIPHAQFYAQTKITQLLDRLR
jgi:hypothetical protein